MATERNLCHLNFLKITRKGSRQEVHVQSRHFSKQLFGKSGKYFSVLWQSKGQSNFSMPLNSTVSQTLYYFPAWSVFLRFSLKLILYKHSKILIPSLILFTRFDHTIYWPLIDWRCIAWNSRVSNGWHVIPPTYAQDGHNNKQKQHKAG